MNAFKHINQGQRQLIAALADPQAEIRLAALASLGEDAGPTVTSAIKQRLEDQDPAVRAAAVEALAGRKALPGHRGACSAA